MGDSANNYAGLAIPVAAIVQALKAKIRATPVTGADVNQRSFDDPPRIVEGPSMFVLLDEKFEELVRQANLNSKLCNCPSFDAMLSNGYLDADVEFRGRFNPNVGRRPKEGPNSFLARTILMAAGVRDASFYESGFGQAGDCFSLLKNVTGRTDCLDGVKIFPCNTIRIDVNAKPCPGLAVVKDPLLQPFVESFAANGTLNVLDPGQARKTVTVPCLKSALGDLLEIHEAVPEAERDYEAIRYRAHALELWMHYLLDSYLESRECFCNIRVQSTYAGSALADKGGMRAGKPYVIWGEGLYPYGEDDEKGWSDPREQEDDDGCVPPKKLLQAREILLGAKSSGDWVSLHPTFLG